MPRNRPEHFHVWRKAKGDRIFYVLRRPFNTSQAAGQWAKRREPDKARFMVLRCTEERCAPRLD